MLCQYNFFVIAKYKFGFSVKTNSKIRLKKNVKKAELVEEKCAFLKYNSEDKRNTIYNLLFWRFDPPLFKLNVVEC